MAELAYQLIMGNSSPAQRASSLENACRPAEQS
jgi:hypothetical protein